VISSIALILLVLLGLFAGALGAAIGIGGGIVVVPALVLGFGYDIRIAVAASLVAVVATSTAAGASYVGEGLANMRLGMTLEVATTIGGITGGLIALAVSPDALGGVFAVMMLVTAVLMIRKGKAEKAGIEHDDEAQAAPASEHDGWEDVGGLGGAFYDAKSDRLIPYQVERLPLGSGISALAGLLSGMLGVGGGFLKVPAMTLGMKVPIRVAAATSNFMIGVTAISSLVVYFARGYVHPLVAVPIAIGIAVGARAGTKIAARMHPDALSKVMAVVLVAVAVQMALNAVGISFR
jgi:uncharacterized membrane protein YfcA